MRTTDGWRRAVATGLLAAAAVGLEPAERTAGGSASGWGVDWLADALWLRLNLAWEARDAVAVERLTTVVLTAAPAESGFRVGAARILAHDLPAWRAEAAPGAPRAVVAAWRAEGHAAAQALLAAGDPADPRRWLEAGVLALRVGDDPALAAACFRRAAVLPGSPGAAARIHARLLAETGRADEARAWLRRWLARPPAGAGARSLDEARRLLRALERRPGADGEPL